jgi:acyl dehydratase
MMIRSEGVEIAKQLYWEDMEVGIGVPPPSKVATRLMLVKWAGASGDFNPLHYDDSFATSQGVGKPIVHGQLKRVWLVQLLTEWIGEKGKFKNFLPIQRCRRSAFDEISHRA